MAATAFLAASSRSSAAVMGRPLSVRIRLASWTLVPGRHGRARSQQVRTKPRQDDKKRLGEVEADVPSAFVFKNHVV